MGIPRNKITIFYLLSFLGGLSFNIIAPFFVVFGLSLGLTIAQTAVLLGVASLSIFVFEIPTGIFADSYGRKKSVLLCYFLSIFYALIYFLSANYYFLLIGSIISGLAVTFITGAFEALLVDSLNLASKENLRNKIFVRLTVITTLGFVVGGLAASSIAYFNLKYIWLFQALVAFLSLIIGWFALKEKFYPSKKIIRYKKLTKIIFDKVRSPFVFIIKNKKISLMLLTAILMALAGAFFIISWPIIFKNLAIPIYYFGLISSIAGLFFPLGSLVAEKFSFKKGTLNTLVLTLILLAFSYIIFALSKNIILSLLSFVLIDLFNGSFTPLFNSLFNKFIPSSKRATMISFYSFSEKGGTGLGEITVGALLTIITAPLVVLSSAALIFLSLIPFLKLRGISKIQVKGD